jgi:hypothetical protein
MWRDRAGDTGDDRPVVVERTDDLVIVDRRDDPVIVDRRDDPVIVDRRDDPALRTSMREPTAPERVGERREEQVAGVMPVGSMIGRLLATLVGAGLLIGGAMLDWLNGIAGTSMSWMSFYRTELSGGVAVHHLGRHRHLGADRTGDPRWGG